MTAPDAERTPEDGWAELEALEREQARKQEERDRKQAARARDPRVQRGVLARLADDPGKLDEYLEPVADATAASIVALALRLAELDLISEEAPGTPRWQIDLGTGERVDAIEVDHPDGSRLYTLDGVDTVMATRMRDDGRYEHAVLDEHGVPMQWRTSILPAPPERPDLN